jgi:hypothetical protein
MKLDKITKSNDPELSELFKKYFSSVHSNYILNLNNFIPPSPDMIKVSNLQFSLSKIFQDWVVYNLLVSLI